MTPQAMPRYQEPEIPAAFSDASDSFVKIWMTPFSAPSPNRRRAASPLTTSIRSMWSGFRELSGEEEPPPVVVTVYLPARSDQVRTRHLHDR